LWADLWAVGHALEPLVRPGRTLCLLDSETTGITDDSRIVELGMILIKADQPPVEWRSLVNPEMPIPAAATAVHHITDLHVALGCRHCGWLIGDHPVPAGASQIWPEDPCETWMKTPTFREMAPTLARGFALCDFAGKNIRFDLGKLAAEFSRVGVPWSPAGAVIICNDRLEHLGEPRDMQSLYRRRTGKEPPLNAHSALADTRMAAEALIGQIAAFPNLPWGEVEKLHDAQWPGWIDSEGKFRFKDGVAVVAFGKKHRDMPMSQVPKTYWQWMIAAKPGFSPEIVKIATDALAGKYPRASGPVEEEQPF